MLHCVVTHVNAVAVAITLSTPSESHYQLHYTHWLLLSVLINLDDIQSFLHQKRRYVETLTPSS